MFYNATLKNPSFQELLRLEKKGISIRGDVTIDGVNK